MDNTPLATRFEDREHPPMRSFDRVITTATYQAVQRPSATSFRHHGTCLASARSRLLAVLDRQAALHSLRVAGSSLPSMIWAAALSRSTFMSGRVRHKHQGSSELTAICQKDVPAGRLAPSSDMSLITTLSAPRTMSVPALLAKSGTMIRRIAEPTCLRIILISFSAASMLPPVVWRSKSTSRFVGILCKQVDERHGVILINHTLYPGHVAEQESLGAVLDSSNEGLPLVAIRVICGIERCLAGNWRTSNQV